MRKEEYWALLTFFFFLAFFCMSYNIISLWEILNFSLDFIVGFFIQIGLRPFSFLPFYVASTFNFSTTTSDVVVSLMKWSYYFPTKMTPKIHLQGITWAICSNSSVNTVHPLPKFEESSKYLENFTLVCHLVGRVPPKSILHDWMENSWAPHVIQLTIT